MKTSPFLWLQSSRTAGSAAKSVATASGVAVEVPLAAAQRCFVDPQALVAARGFSQNPEQTDISRTSHDFPIYIIYSYYTIYIYIMIIDRSPRYPIYKPHSYNPHLHQSIVSDRHPLRVQRRGRKNSTLDPLECQGVVDWPTDSCLSGSSTRKAPTTETDGTCWKLLLEKWRCCDAGNFWILLEMRLIHLPFSDLAVWWCLVCLFKMVVFHS